jgi:hypothetical protein
LTCGAGSWIVMIMADDFQFVDIGIFIILREDGLLWGRNNIGVERCI